MARESEHEKEETERVALIAKIDNELPADLKTILDKVKSHESRVELLLLEILKTLKAP